MKYISLLFAFGYIFRNASVYCYSCKTLLSKERNTVEFRCSELLSLQKYLDKATSNTTIITISDSDISEIPGHTFARFGGELRTLDLNNAGIKNVDLRAFVALTKLENLMLWGNKLTWLPMEWFTDTYNLKTLDVSFNFIENIDYRAFQMLPHLENFYFDYNQLRSIDFNMFAYMTKLKKVRVGKNPWNWAVRTRLMWQLENQNVDVINDFEDWNWMSKVVKFCIESDQYDLPNDNVLDCAVGKLLEFVREIEERPYIQQRTEVSCTTEAEKLITCMTPKNSSTNAKYETMRVILQDMSYIFASMYNAQSLFSIKLFV